MPSFPPETWRSRVVGLRTVPPKRGGVDRPIGNRREGHRGDRKGAQQGSGVVYLGLILGDVVFATDERSTSVRALRYWARLAGGSPRDMRDRYAESVGVPSRIGQIAQKYADVEGVFIVATGRATRQVERTWAEREVALERISYTSYNNV